MVTGIANAYIVTIEPDDYAPGTNLQNVVEGVRLTSTRGTPVTAVEPCAVIIHCYTEAATGQLAFGPDAEWYVYGQRPTENVDPFDPNYMHVPGYGSAFEWHQVW